MKKITPYLMIAIVALVAVAIASRVEMLRKTVFNVAS
jgi:hypothetical protein